MYKSGARDQHPQSVSSRGSRIQQGQDDERFSFSTIVLEGEKQGLSRDAIAEDVPQCLRGEAFTRLLNESLKSRVKFPYGEVQLSKADVSSAFRNASKAPDETLNYCYAVDDLIAADVRPTDGWTRFPGQADVSSVFRDSSVASDQTQNRCYAVEDGVVADVRPTYGWKRSPSYWGHFLR